MSYNIEIFKENKHKTSKWSGGTTTQLYIYPEDSLYDERNFEWRLSSAKVEVEKSIFTSLPGISRKIMVLEGELLLEHEGHHNAALKVFEQDSFSGGWTTISFGKVTDFNLMMSTGYKGELEAISFSSGDFKDILLHNNVNDTEVFSQITEAFYMAKGYVEIDTELKGKIGLSKGDLLLVTRMGKEITSEFKMHSNSKSESIIIKASIFYCE
ncbi:HutD family protein [Clostridium sp.]